MIKRKLACLAAAAVIGAAVFAAPAQAHGGGGGGGGWHTAWRGPVSGGAAWNGAGWRGAAWHGRFFPHHRFAFFRHRFVGPFFGAVYAGGSCWNWIPTPVGWRSVWVCGYPYGYGYY
jgi:hypothetical protein